MTLHHLSKWIFIICLATLVFNGFLYFGVQKQELLYSIIPAIIVGLISGVYFLSTRKNKHYRNGIHLPFSFNFSL